MTNQEILMLNEEGFIPGPQETEEMFLKRVRETQEFFSNGEWIPEAHWSWVRPCMKEIFDFRPTCVAARYSNEKLTPWQGAVVWIDRVSTVQLREGLRKGSYLGIYSREEILSHESAHMARAGFNEDRYEEFFAHMTSDKKWRRVLGPIVQRPWEVWPLLGAVGMGALYPICYWMAIVWIGLGFGRLIKRHQRLERAAGSILKVVEDERSARAVLFRLTDEEIDRFARGESVEMYAAQQNCLRWRLIRLAYLKNEGSNG
jgi:hypothetical protein